MRQKIAREQNTVVSRLLKKYIPKTKIIKNLRNSCTSGQKHPAIHQASKKVLFEFGNVF